MKIRKPPTTDRVLWDCCTGDKIKVPGSGDFEVLDTTPNSIRAENINGGEIKVFSYQTLFEMNTLYRWT